MILQNQIQNSIRLALLEESLKTNLQEIIK